MKNIILALLMSILTLNVFSQTDTIHIYHDSETFATYGDSLEWGQDVNCIINVSLHINLRNEICAFPNVILTDTSGEAIQPHLYVIHHILSNSANDTIVNSIEYSFMFDQDTTFNYCLHVGDTCGYTCFFTDDAWPIQNHVKDTCKIIGTTNVYFHTIVGNNPLGINEISHSKKLVRIIDETGRDAEPVPNRLLIYIYDDGTKEKKIIIEK